MEKRKPFNIERILLFYNGIQVLANFSIVAYVSRKKSLRDIELNGVYNVVFGLLILFTGCISNQYGIR